MDIQWKHRVTTAALVAALVLTPVAAQAAIVMQGHRGPEVQELQEQLAELGFLVGTPDGIFGPATKNALKEFQGAENLPVDGVAGPETLAALEQVFVENGPAEAALQEMASQGFSEHGLLRRGDRKPGVTVLQETLVHLGYLEAEPNGVFGPQTERAVKEFQASTGSLTDGMVGQETWAALAAALQGQPKASAVIVAATTRKAEEAPSAAAETQVVSIEETMAAVVEHGLVRRGDRSDVVLGLQQILVELDLLTVEPNGVFGPQTEAAVKAFQRSVNVAADGMVGSQTWSALATVLDSAAAAEETAEVAVAAVTAVPESASVKLTNHGIVRRGDRSDAVKQLQQALAELGLLTAEPNGVFGPQTETAVRQAQAWLGLGVDGVVGPATWSALAERLTVMDEAVMAADLPELEGTMRQGDRGEQVVMVQERLAALNFLQGRADGIFGPATRQAVQSFQRSAGLTPDGVVGQKTWEAMVATRPGQYVPVVVEDMHWRDVQRIFAVGDVVTVEDVETGLTWRVQRLYGSNHADVEPLTTADTRIMRQVFGGSWSWERRAVIVKIGDRLVAASINGYPHGGQNITTNQFPGHICMHFRGSQLHLNGRSDPDHQAMVQRSTQATPQSIQVR